MEDLIYFLAVDGKISFRVLWFYSIFTFKVGILGNNLNNKARGYANNKQNTYLVLSWLKNPDASVTNCSCLSK